MFGLFSLVVVTLVCIFTKNAYQRMLMIYTVLFPVTSLFVGMRFAGFLFDHLNGDLAIVWLLIGYLIFVGYLYVKGISYCMRRRDETKKATDEVA